MAKGLIKDSTLTAIANAIREKTETTGTMLPSEMAALIQGITGAKVAYGKETYSVNSADTTATITHGLGETPNLFVMFESSAPINYGRNILEALMPDGSLTHFWGSTQGVSYGNSTIYITITPDAEKVTVKGTSYMRGENTWIAGVVK